MSYELSFSETGAANVLYSLLELPADLLQLVEASLAGERPLVIKGLPDDDAVLCSRDRTHTLRACVNSDSLLLCHAVAPDWDNDTGQPSIRVDSTLHQTLEVILARPKSERLEELLGGQEWTGEDERPTKRIRRFTRDELFDQVQASDAELELALDTQRVLEIDGFMRKVDGHALAKLLTGLLQTFSGHSINTDSFDLDATVALFADEMDIAPAMASKVVQWFSSDDRDHGKRALASSAIAREIGLSLLDNWRFDTVAEGAARHNRIPLKAFETKWKAAMTDSFAVHCSRRLLDGHYIYGDAPEPHLISIPAHSLPLEPAARFARLFSFRQKWLPEDMIPFLDPISLDVKEREKWVLKYARKVKVPGAKAGGTIWVAR